MPTTTRAHKKKAPMPKIQAPKLKASVLARPNAFPDSQDTHASPQHSPEDTPSLSQQLSRPTTPDYCLNTSMHSDRDLPQAKSPDHTDNASTHSTPISAHNRTIYPNSYGITLDSQPLNTTSPTTNPTTTDPATDDQPEGLFVSQSPKSKLPTEETSRTPHVSFPPDHSTDTSDANPPPGPVTDTVHTSSPPDPTSLQQELFTLKTKHAKAQHHLTFLETSLTDNIIPKGFHLNITPQVMDAQHTDIEDAWTTALKETSKKLITLTHEHYTHVLESLKNKIADLEAKLAALEITHPPEQHTTQLAALETKLERTRRNKLDHLKNNPRTQVNNATNIPPRPSSSSFLSNTQSHQQQHRTRQRRSLLPTPHFPPPYLTRLQPLPTYNPFQHYHGPAPPPLMSLPPVQLPLHLQPQYNQPQLQPRFPNADIRPLF